MKKHKIADLLSSEIGETLTIAVDLHKYKLGDAREATVHGSIDATRMPEGVLASFALTKHLIASCDRCLKQIEQTGPLRFRIEYLDDTKGQPDAYPIERDQIDITTPIEAELILSLPIVLLCKEHCKGICPVCGVNRNDVNCGHKTVSETPEKPFAKLKKLKTKLK